MAVVQKDAVNSAGDQLRREPLAKRIRASVDGVTVVDTTAAELVWEPRRLLCEYAVPESSLAAQLSGPRPATAPSEADGTGPIYPNVPFAVHTTAGQSFDVQVGDRVLEGAAFRPDDPDLAGYLVLDFHAFDAWQQEDEANIGHPRDPYHRIDTYPTSRRVRVTHGDVVLADSTQAMALFEAMLPPRFYLPRQDVLVDLTPTDTSTACAYKGWASYWSAGAELVDVAWSYEDPLPDSQRIASYVAFDDSKVTVTVDPR